MKPRRVISYLLTLFQFLLFLKLVEYAVGVPQGRQMGFGVGPFQFRSRQSPKKNISQPNPEDLLQGVNSTQSLLEEDGIVSGRSFQGAGYVRQKSYAKSSGPPSNLVQSNTGVPTKGDPANILVSTLPLMRLYLAVFTKSIAFIWFLYIWKVLFYPVDDPAVSPPGHYPDTIDNFGQKQKAKPPSILYNKFIQGLLKTFVVGRSFSEYDLLTTTVLRAIE